MGRAPCCEKMGLKKGPWTRDEDQMLIHYINLYGHGNWRALPKQAGLLRCGKSCRLRWINYLRPDLKRGNFTREEEETIIKLHEAMGNRWSAIAARLPGRTDNEIKNVWHTHLKKRLKNIEATSEAKQGLVGISKFEQKMEKEEEEEEESRAVNITTSQTSTYQPNSPQHSSSDISSVATTTGDSDNTCMNADIILDAFPEVDENFWSEVFSAENSGETSNFPAVQGDIQLQFPVSPLFGDDSGCGYNLNLHEDMDFWYGLFTRAGE